MSILDINNETINYKNLKKMGFEKQWWGSPKDGLIKDNRGRIIHKFKNNQRIYELYDEEHNINIIIFPIGFDFENNPVYLSSTYSGNKNNDIVLTKFPPKNHNLSYNQPIIYVSSIGYTDDDTFIEENILLNISDMCDLKIIIHNRMNTK